MAQFFENIEAQHQAFIERQQMFFVATAASDGSVNLSPKGLDSLRVLSPTKIAWYNLTGSGNETAAHILQNPRMTVMFCAFEGKPWIYRVYGTAKMLQPSDREFNRLLTLFPSQKAIRQVFVLDVERTIGSCGMGVPLYDYIGQRDGLVNHFKPKSDDEITQYQQKRNRLSIDGYPTGLDTKQTTET